jgi:hypothetical protein
MIAIARTLSILNDAPYGTQRSYNGLPSNGSPACSWARRTCSALGAMSKQYARPSASPT